MDKYYIITRNFKPIWKSTPDDRFMCRVLERFVNFTFIQGAPKTNLPSVASGETGTLVLKIKANNIAFINVYNHNWEEMTSETILEELPDNLRIIDADVIGIDELFLYAQREFYQKN